MPRVPGPERAGAARDIAAFAAELGALTNYEVQKRLDAMIPVLAASCDTLGDEWPRFRALLNELHWRLSGL